MPDCAYDLRHQSRALVFSSYKSTLMPQLENEMTFRARFCSIGLEVMAAAAAFRIACIWGTSAGNTIS